MTIAREIQGGESYGVSADDLRVLLYEARQTEQRVERKLARMARGASITDSKLGTISGIGLGLLSGISLASGIIPGAAHIAEMSSVLPFVGGAFGAAIGMLIGSFVDLDGVTRQD